jgi:hypothetical protein
MTRRPTLLLLLGSLWLAGAAGAAALAEPQGGSNEGGHRLLQPWACTGCRCERGGGTPLWACCNGRRELNCYTARVWNTSAGCQAFCHGPPAPPGAAAPLLQTRWAQRWGFAQFSPLDPTPGSDSGLHWRLGCAATALAQIMFFHRRCPAGTVNYTAPGYSPTGMNFSSEAGLCDWGSMPSAPLNWSSDPGMRAVAKFE